MLRKKYYKDKMDLIKMLKGGLAQLRAPVEISPLSKLLKSRNKPVLEEAVQRLKSAEGEWKIGRARAYCMIVFSKGLRRGDDIWPYFKEYIDYLNEQKIPTGILSSTTTDLPPPKYEEYSI